MSDLLENILRGWNRIPVRARHYLMFLLLYGCSFYHFVFSEIVLVKGESFLSFFVQQEQWDFFFEHYGVGWQEYKFRKNLLLLYGFGTFSIMTVFMVFDYYIRKAITSSLSIKGFLEAFLFSQLAYIGYIQRFIDYINGVHAFDSGISFFFIYIPMAVVSIPLSIFLFNKISKVIKHQELVRRTKTDRKRENKILIFDYLIFWGGTLAGAVIVSRF